MNGGLRNKDEVGRHTTNRMSIDDRSTASCTIVVVAKCPIPGHCKTRLIPMLGSIGAAALSKAMLADVLTSVDQCVRGRHRMSVL